MLRHHSEEEHAPDLGLTPKPKQSQITPQEQVTPHELAQAIVSVETCQRANASRPARQRADAPAPMQTASLEDTIRQLELTMTPAELLAELHAQRTVAHQKAVMTPRKTGRNLSWWLMLAGLVLSTVTTACVSLLLFMVVKRYDKLASVYYNRPPSHASRQKTPASPRVRPPASLKSPPKLPLDK